MEMNGSKFLSAGWAPVLACFACAFGISMVHWSLFNTMPDAASAMQTFHGIVNHGLGARNSLEGVPVFAVHLWFLPLLAVPIFALFPTYPTLVAVQAIVLALSVPAARRLALSTGMSDGNANRWTWFWALHPLVLGPHCGWGEGYQPLIFAVTPILWSLVFAREEKWTAFLACLALALACREDVALTTLGIGIWAWWTMGNRKAGASAIALSLAWATVATFLILPHLGGGSWNVLDKAFPSHHLATSWRSTLAQGSRNFFQPSSFGFLLIVYLAWGGFTRKSGHHLLAVLPLCAALFLVEAWITRNPFLHYAAPLSPLFFHAALLEARPSGHFGWRWRLGWLAAVFALFAWQGRLLYHGINGADRKSLTCLESKIPRDRSLSLFSPRGATRFAWGQDLTWMDPDIPPADFTLIETGRKTPGWWNPTELAAMEVNLAAKGASIVYQAPTVRLWALRDHRKIECP